MTVGERIKDLREQQGLTLEELGNKVGVGKSTVRKWENGMIENMRRDKIAKLAYALGVTPLYLMGWEDKNKEHPLPRNISVPAAYPVPILGTIGCGEGPIGEQNFDGFFYIDRAIRADYALHTKGDSMIDAGIQDGDVAFLIKDFDVVDGQIYAVVFGADDEAVLKKVYRSDSKVILQSCNSEYAPIILDQVDVRLIGKLTWICHKAQ